MLDELEWSGVERDVVLLQLLGVGCYGGWGGCISVNHTPRTATAGN
jgi:hypothetical protein